MGLIMIAVVLGLLQYVPMMSESLAQDGLALLDFKDGLTVTSPLLANWKASDTSPCSWSGVSCSKSGDVQNVALPAQEPELEGNISSSLGKLKYLEEIVLTNNLLTGSIPHEIGKLSRLKVLDLSGNRLSGVIPPQLGNCSGLVTLWLHGNTLSGAFPESLGHLRNLSSVFIGKNIPNQSDIEFDSFEQNSINGSVPMGIFENPNLVSFDVSNNNLGGDITSALEKMSKHQNIESISMEHNRFVGMLPPSIGNATTLLQLNLLQQSDRFLESGGFGGQIPKEIGKLVNLLRFYISNNNFFGEIPNEIGKMTSLIALDFSSNNMNGTIPSSLGNLVNLRRLSLSHNHFSGPIPISFGSLTKLILFSLDNNGFIGPIPHNISNATHLQQFFINNNQFSGSIPKDFGRFMPNLSEIDVSHNFFHGLLPSGLCQGNQELYWIDFHSNQLQRAIPMLSFAKCTSYIHVNLNNNRFTSIPDGFGSNSSLSWFDASHNQFSEPLPTNLGINSQLNCLKLNNNKFTGNISRLEFSNLAHRLMILNLANNNFTGQIPATMTTCKFLYEVDLSSNSLIGNVPLEFKNLSRLETLKLQNNSLTYINPNIFSSWANVSTLDLSSNPWNNSIPSEIGSLILLENLNLSYGGLSGIIPSEFGKLTRLRVLDLSHNNLTGEVPRVLGELMVSLNFIEISFNNLTVSLPPKWVKFFNANPNSFMGNPNLCIEYNATTNVCTNLSSIGNFQNKTKFSSVIKLLAVLGIFLVLIILAAFVFQWYISMKGITNLQLLNDVFIQNLTNDTLPFTFEEIMAITNNLSDAHIIGQGGHGVVYKVASTISHTTIVVKKIESLDTTTPLIHKSFWREVETVENTKHRNLIRLLGFMRWSKMGLLLYEYVPNGDLHTALHKREGQGIDLPWKVRLCIAKGVAEGLAYLHHDYNTPIVHRDIKSSNVLLDNNLEAHISDFGLAKVLETQSESQEYLSMPNIYGTYGYIAPEVGYGTLVTPKLDVYSFGILLLELLTGRQPINGSLGETWHIDAWVRASVVENKGRMSNLVLDPLLIDTTSLATIEEMLFVQRIALLCTTFNPCDRPTMRDVVSLLKSLNQKTIVKNVERENVEEL